MGMFDSVTFQCPACKRTTEVQSKAGRCLLDVHDQNFVPPEIARDLDGEKHQCDHCDYIFTIRMLQPILNIPMKAD